MTNTVSDFRGRAGHTGIKLKEQQQDTSIATTGLPRYGLIMGPSTVQMTLFKQATSEMLQKVTNLKAARDFTGGWNFTAS